MPSVFFLTQEVENTKEEAFAQVTTILVFFSCLGYLFNCFFFFCVGGVFVGNFLVGSY